jgi:purine-binding chemotaxis protein CheW
VKTNDEARELALGAFPDRDRELRILKERAELAAQVRGEESESEVRLATFRLGPHVYGVPLDAVFAITLVQSITPLPGVGGGLIGLIMVRGRHVTALDLSVFLGTPGETRNRHIADFGKSVTVAFADRRLAFLCEEVLAVRDLSQGDLHPLDGAEDVAPIRQVGPDALQVIDLAALFSDPRLFGAKPSR